jgi:hypothetical protein
MIRGSAGPIFLWQNRNYRGIRAFNWTRVSKKRSHISGRFSGYQQAGRPQLGLKESRHEAPDQNSCPAPSGEYFKRINASGLPARGSKNASGCDGLNKDKSPVSRARDNSRHVSRVLIAHGHQYHRTGCDRNSSIFPLQQSGPGACLFPQSRRSRSRLCDRHSESSIGDAQ